MNEVYFLTVKHKRDKQSQFTVTDKNIKHKSIEYPDKEKHKGNNIYKDGAFSEIQDKITKIKNGKK